MRIVNAMFGRGRGGIEQAFLDYTRALQTAGHAVLPMVHPAAAIIQETQDLSDEVCRIANAGAWDPLAVLRLKRQLRRWQPDLIVCHGNRAAMLLRKAAKNRNIPVVGVAHNYLVKRFARLDAAIAITADIARHLEACGVPSDRIFRVPNMIALPEQRPDPRPFHTPPVIGSLGRFVPKKGFDTFIRALGLLREEGLPFRAMLAGDGPEKATLQTLAHEQGLDEHLLFFPGWVTDKAAFFNAIDVFALPSLHEPFGIVVLEAFAHGVPLITSDCEGPREICTPERDALVFPKDSASELARAIVALLRDPAHAAGLAEAGYRTAEQHYALPVVSDRLDTVIAHILNRHRTTNGAAP